MVSKHEVIAHVRNDEHDRAAVLSQKLLEADPTDEDSFHTALIGWVNASKAHLAVKLIDRYPDLASARPFASGYALYRAGEFERAAQMATATSDAASDPSALATLEAQSLYRLGDYAKALEVYERIANGAGGSLSVEMLSNMTAAAASGSNPRAALERLFGPECVDEDGAVVDDSAVARETYELLYNAACASMRIGDHAGALERLATAAESCRARLAEEDLAEDEIDDEAAPIDTQRAVALQSLGRDAEAKSLYEAVVARDPSDATLPVVASVNTSVMKGATADPIEALRVATEASSAEVTPKLTVVQRQVVAFNRALAMIAANKPAADVTAHIERRLEPLCVGGSSGNGPSGDLPALAKSALLHRDRDYDGARKVLADRAGRSGATVRIRLAHAQCALTASDFSGAAEIVSGIDEIAHRPQVAISLAWLREKAGDKDGALAAIDAAAAHHGALGAEGRAVRLELERRAGDLLLGWGRSADAAARFEAILKEDKRNTDALARLVMATSETDIRAAEKAVKSLMDPPKPSIDVEVLERTPTLVKSADTAAAAAGAKPTASSGASDAAGDAAATAGGGASSDATAGAGGATTTVIAGENAGTGLTAAQIQARRDRQRKRKRKPRYPAGVDPEDPNKPAYDASRWLPKWERAKGKGKKTNKGTKGAQGLAPQDAREAAKLAALDRSKDDPNAASASSPSQQSQKPKKKSRRKK